MKSFKSIVSLILFSAISIVCGFAVGGPIATALNEHEYVQHISWSIGGGVISLGVASALFNLNLFTRGTYAGEFTAGLCERVQTSLNEILGSKAPSSKRTKTGYLQAITSPQNTAGVEMLPIDPGNGKKRKVLVKYIQRGTEDDIVETQNTTCAQDIEKEPFEQEVDITRYIRTKGIKFDDNEMRKLCEPDSQWMGEIVNAEIDALVRVLNKRMLTIQSTNFGAFNPSISPATKKQVQLLKDSGENARFKGEAEIMEDFEYLDTMDRPILVGAGNLSMYAKLAKVGCCNSGGVNLAQAGDFDFFHDRFAGSILGGANDFIGLVPGYVQLLTWNKYVGTYRKDNQTFSHGTIMDPVSGLTFDMKWHYNDCNDTWSLFFGLWYDMFFLPSDAFAEGDELEDVNFTLHYEATDEDPYL